MALQKRRDRPYDMVISDWNMEPMTGLQLLKEVRSDTRLKTLPFLMITAESKPENVIEAKKAGVNNYIVKPFNADTLRTKLSSVLGAAVCGKHGRRHDRARRRRRGRPRDHDDPRRRSCPGRIGREWGRERGWK